MLDDPHLVDGVMPQFKLRDKTEPHEIVSSLGHACDFLDFPRDLRPPLEKNLCYIELYVPLKRDSGFLCMSFYGL